MIYLQILHHLKTPYSPKQWQKGPVSMPQPVSSSLLNCDSKGEGNGRPPGPGPCCYQTCPSAFHYIDIQYSTSPTITLHYVPSFSKTVEESTLHHSTIHYNTRNTTQYNTSNPIHHNKMHYNTIRYITTQHNTWPNATAQHIVLHSTTVLCK
jgi:hypothetical protein